MKREVAEALLDIRAISFSPHYPFTFKSGIKSPIYIDTRRLIYRPQQWHTIIDGFIAIIANSSLEYDALAGVAVGGVPHSSALAFTFQQPTVFVRKENKEYGKKQRIEGGNVSGKRVLLIEDLVTTGGSSLSAVAALRKTGAEVSDVITIFSYGFPEATKSFESNNVNLHTLTDFGTILLSSLKHGFCSPEEISAIQDWRKTHEHTD